MKMPRVKTRGIHGRLSALLKIHSAQSVGDASLAQVVGRHFHSHAIARGETDEVFSHFPGYMREDFVFIVEHDTKHRAGQHGRYGSFNFNGLFSAHP